MPRDDDEALSQEQEWQAIVENFGDRAVLPEDEAPPAEAAPAPEAAEDDDPAESEDRDTLPPDEEFVPPTPPPIPRPPNDRLAAWLGLFGAPVVVLICVVLGISVPAWLGLVLAASFVGGFLYLVARLPGSPRDPWDDGAVL